MFSIVYKAPYDLAPCPSLELHLLSLAPSFTTLESSLPFSSSNAPTCSYIKQFQLMCPLCAIITISSWPSSLLLTFGVPMKTLDPQWHLLRHVSPPHSETHSRLGLLIIHSLITLSLLLSTYYVPLCVYVINLVSFFSTWLYINKGRNHVSYLPLFTQHIIFNKFLKNMQIAINISEY